jgi:hypothetical protein
MRPHSRAAYASGTIIALSLVLAILASRHAAVAAASPVRPTGNWIWVWRIALGVAFVAYVAGVLALRRRRARLTVVLAVAAVIQLAPLGAPLLLSTDTYTYWDYGRVAAVHHANPFRTPPSRFPNDPAYALMGASWHDETTIYGPVFTALSQADAAATDSPPAAVRFYRVLAAVSVLAAALLASLLSARAGFAAAFIGWNPLLALHFGGGGHNDAIMMALVLGALLLVRKGRPNAAGPAWVAAIGVKWLAAAFLPLVLVAEHRQGRRLGLPLLAVSGVAVGALATILYGTAWPHAAGRLAHQARATGSIGLSKWLGEAGLSHRPTVVLLALAQLVLYSWLLRHAWRGRARLGMAGVGLAALQGWLNPWYAAWGVTLSAAEDDRLAQGLSILLSGFLLRDAIPL